MKTVKEVAKSYVYNVVRGMSIEDEFSVSTIEYAFIDGVEFAQRWISVEEELPEYAMETVKEGNYTHTVSSVIVKTSNGRYAIAKRRMFLDHGWEWMGSGTFNRSVTHWRRIEF
ncbi:MAG: hypothetical protein LBK96_02480 [Prevotellaceae bacterium]|jgi:hypothetical protein|nr:hypothetical protein [Prevotellaceae bacterium]